MTVSDDQQRSMMIGAMVFRTQDDLSKGLKNSRDHELLLHFMTLAYDNGFRLENIVEHLHRRRHGYGVFRDKKHIVTVVLAHSLHFNYGPDRFAVVASTTGDLDGFWQFMLDDDNSLLISRNGRSCTQIGELEGLELMTAVVTSALSMSLEMPKRGLLRRR